MDKSMLIASIADCQARYSKMDKRSRQAKELKKWIEDDQQQLQQSLRPLSQEHLATTRALLSCFAGPDTDETPHAFLLGEYGLVYNQSY